MGATMRRMMIVRKVFILFSPGRAGWSRPAFLVFPPGQVPVVEPPQVPRAVPAADAGRRLRSTPSRRPARDYRGSAKSTKIPTSVTALTGWVVMANVPELLPAAIVRVSGTDA